MLSCRSIFKIAQQTGALVQQKLKSSVTSPSALPNIRPCNVLHQQIRPATFFNKLPAEDLWKGVTSVSNAGKKRGRGKGVGRKIAKNLNKGQVIGVGKANIVWPGLTGPVVRGRELVQQQQLPEDPEREARLIKIRNEMGVFRRLRLAPTERGWSGAKMPGRSLGPPDDIGEDTFEGFDTRVLEMKTVVNMKGNFGRKRRMSVMVVTGNGNGLAGFALAKAVEPKAALRKAKNRAGQQVMHVDLFEGRTVFHDFFSQFGKTKLFVSKKPSGYGLVCHRGIRTICQVLGIKDLHAKVEGSTNLNHIVKAFFIGLLQQKNHHELAEEKGLHLVEIREENASFPRVIASPTVCRSSGDIPSDEIRDLTQYALGGKVVLRKKKWPPFYTNLPFWETVVKKMEKVRNHDKMRLEMMSEYGEVRSFLTDKYPECKPIRFSKLDKNAEEENQ